MRQDMQEVALPALVLGSHPPQAINWRPFSTTERVWRDLPWEENRERWEVTWFRKRRDGAGGFSRENFNWCLSSSSSGYYESCNRKTFQNTYLWKMHIFIQRIIIVFEPWFNHMQLELQIEITSFGGLGRVEKEERQGEKEENRLPSHLQQTSLG